MVVPNWFQYDANILAILFLNLRFILKLNDLKIEKKKIHNYRNNFKIICKSYSF